jgi:hypothetical protein
MMGLLADSEAEEAVVIGALVSDDLGVRFEDAEVAIRIALKG